MDDHGQARGSDPWTAKEAARMVRPGSQRRALLEAHRENPRGMTDEEAAAAAGISPGSEYATRCSELVRAGLLEDTGKSREGSSGMARMVRKITPAGRAALLGETVSPLRSPGRYEAPLGDPECPEHGATCRKVWHRAVQEAAEGDPGEKGEPPLCSCGKGYVGHTDTHESTDRPGIVRIVREGRTDQYMNIAAVERASHAAALQASAEEERQRKAKTPRVDPASHRLTFGGPLLCPRCGGTGGSLLEACYRCSGTGLT